MIPVYHAAGCGGLAFSFIRPPHDGEPVTGAMAVYPDGESPPDDTMALCASCTQPLVADELSLIAPTRKAD